MHDEVAIFITRISFHLLIAGLFTIGDFHETFTVYNSCAYHFTFSNNY